MWKCLLPIVHMLWAVNMIVLGFMYILELVEGSFSISTRLHSCTCKFGLDWKTSQSAQCLHFLLENTKSGPITQATWTLRNSWNYISRSQSTHSKLLPTLPFATVLSLVVQCLQYGAYCLWALCRHTSTVCIQWNSLFHAETFHEKCAKSHNLQSIWNFPSKITKWKM